MDIRRTLVPLAAAILALASVHAGAQATGAQATGFAVLELFTSEGCSSCPPADEALAAVSRAAVGDGRPVYVLEWHVDYWDSLGWKDPFDSPAASGRQYAYARALPSEVYTPQLVINGSLVPAYAGDAVEIERDVRALVGAPSPRRVRVKVLSTEPGSLRVRADVSAASRGTNLLLVLAETGLGSLPTAGENAGRRLVHSNVVRSFLVLPAGSGETRLPVPPGVDLARSMVVGILQDARSMKISDADRAVIPLHAASAPRTGRLTGKVVDAAGRAAGGVMVQACSPSLCVPAVTGPGGLFVFEGLAAGTWDLAFDPGKPAVRVALAAGRDMSLQAPLVLAH